MFGVNGEAAGLAVRSVGTFVWTIGVDRTLVPVEAQPAQVCNELRLVAGFGAFQVSIFDAEKEIAAHAAGEQPVVERRPRTAHVEHSSGGRGKADADFPGCHDTFDDRWCGTMRS